MDGQLLASPNGSYVWKAPDLIFNSSAAKCTDRLPEQATNSKLWEPERRKMDACLSLCHSSGGEEELSFEKNGNQSRWDGPAKDVGRSALCVGSLIHRSDGCTRAAFAHTHKHSANPQIQKTSYKATESVNS